MEKVKRTTNVNEYVHRMKRLNEYSQPIKSDEKKLKEQSEKLIESIKMKQSSEIRKTINKCIEILESLKKKHNVMDAK